MFMEKQKIAFDGVVLLWDSQTVSQPDRPTDCHSLTINKKASEMSDHAVIISLASS